MNENGEINLRKQNKLPDDDVYDYVVIVADPCVYHNLFPKVKTLHKAFLGKYIFPKVKTLHKAFLSKYIFCLSIC